MLGKLLDDLEDFASDPIKKTTDTAKKKIKDVKEDPVGTAIEVGIGAVIGGVIS